MQGICIKFIQMVEGTNFKNLTTFVNDHRLYNFK